MAKNLISPKISLPVYSQIGFGGRDKELAQEMDVDEDINIEDGTEVGSVSSDADTRFACEL